MNSLKLPELEFFDTSNHPDCHCVDMKPDIGVYSTNLKPPDGVTTDFALMELCGELKGSRTDDGFKDPTPRYDTHGSDAKRHAFEHPTGAAEETSGQITSYAAALLARQFRTHAFFFLLTGPSVRIICWDRSCAIVSEAILYASAPKILVEFF
jgi:hypothetical protein